MVLCNSTCNKVKSKEGFVLRITQRRIAWLGGKMRTLKKVFGDEKEQWGSVASKVISN